MSFLAPAMLWGAAAISIPIAIHFFFRSRYRKVPWAAMEFLLASIEQTSRRLKFQELLLLLVRCAVLLLIALALARPLSSTSKGSGRGDAVDAVFVMDVSASMTARDGAKTRLDKAKTSALAVIDHLPPHSTVQVVAVGDRVTQQGPRIAANLEQARELIQNLKASHLASDLHPGVEQAAAILAKGQLPNKELYVFSDMQKLAWDAQSGPLVEKLRDIGKQATIHLVRCGQQEPRNATVVNIVPQAGVPHTGERAGFVVFVRNSGNEAVRNLGVSLMVDGQEKSKERQQVPVLDKGETRAVTLSARLEKPGLRVITAAIDHDDLEADNRFDRLVMVRDQVRILVIDGAPNERDPEKSASYFLMHSLRPVAESSWARYHIQPRMVTVRQAVPALLENMDLVVMANVPVSVEGRPGSNALSPEFLERLEQFVREGKGLWIFGGNKVEPKDYNEVLQKAHDLLPVQLTGKFSTPADKPIRFDPKSVAPQSFLANWRDEPLDPIGQVDIFEALDVAEPKGDAKKQAVASVLVRYSNSRPALISRRIGMGEVMLVTTSPDPSWTDWPLRPAYLPFVHLSLSYLLEGQTQSLNRVAGQPLRWNAPDGDTGRAYALIHPDGRRVRLGTPELPEGRPVITTNDTPLAGIYRILPAERLDPNNAKPDPLTMTDGAPFAVVPDLRESEDLSSLTNVQLDERLAIPVVHQNAGDDPAAAFSGSERFSREWTTRLLAILLGLVLFETLLAWWCGRPS